MSLRDTACYTLSVVPSSKDPSVVELFENEPAAASGSGSSGGDRQAKYVRLREKTEGEGYSACIYDAYSSAKLGSMGYGTLKDKKRRLELHGPDEVVSFEFTGKINFEWTFIFEGNKYRWTRELYGKDYICSLDRKPDPRVEVCLARESDKNAPARLQILHYNIDRFPNDIKDQRGLETLLVATLMCFVDTVEDRNGPLRPRSTTPAIIAPAASSSNASPVPDKPPKIISEEDFEPENPNEIVVGMQTNIDEHVARAVGLLEDPHVLFMVIRTRNPTATSRALEVSLGVTRFRHHEGLDDINQYVIEEEPFKSTPSPSASSSSGKKAGPAVIILDDPEPAKLAPKRSPPTLKKKSSNALKPPKSDTNWVAPNIAIYLSKIELPDLVPGRRETLRGKTSGLKLSPGGNEPTSSTSSKPSNGKSSPGRKLPSSNPPVAPNGSGFGRPAPPTGLHAPAPSDFTRSPLPNQVPTKTPSPGPPTAPASSSFGGGSVSGGQVSLTRLFKAAAGKI